MHEFIFSRAKKKVNTKNEPARQLVLHKLAHSGRKSAQWPHLARVARIHRHAFSL